MDRGGSAQLKRLEKIEQRLKKLSKFLPDCICFPEKEQPFFGFIFEGNVAFSVKCPLHGDRFEWPKFHLYVPKWRREGEEKRRAMLSAKYRKAWEASFPSQLFPAEEQESEDGTYLLLKNGTRVLVSSRSWAR